MILKILAIASRLPYPPTDGARICMFQSVTALALLGHEVHLVAVEDQAYDTGPLQECCRLHLVAERQLPRLVGQLATILSSRPYTQWKTDSRRVYLYLDRLQRAEKFDVCYVDQTHVACYGSYLKREHGLPYLLRTHNIEYEIYSRYATTLTNPLTRRYVALQCARWKRYETQQFRMADACAVITDRDKIVTEHLAPGVSVDVVPGSVDITSFPYIPVDVREDKSLLLVGNTAWLPNRVGTLWFTNEIFPIVAAAEPEVICRIVGNNSGLRGLRHSPNIRLHGSVDNIRPMYDRATIGVLPVRVAGGMRIKMLEMMSAGLPIVTTGMGAEGNAAIAGLHYSCADDPQSFANAIIGLLRNPVERQRLSLAARSFVAEHYDVRQIGRKFENLLLRTIELSRKSEMQQQN